MKLYFDLKPVPPSRASTGGYAHLQLRPFRIENNERRWFAATSGEAETGFELCDLVISCQIDARETETASYGWACEYKNVYSIDAARAARMHKTLTKLRRKLDSFQETEGYPASFGAYVNRVMRAFGAAELVEIAEDDGQRHFSLREVPWLVDRRVGLLKEACKRLAA